MTFLVQKPVFLNDQHKILFRFSLGIHHFTETLTLPARPKTRPAPPPHFTSLLNLSACVLGTSYFKLLAPKTIAIEQFCLTPLQQQLVLDVYENGMGEFYARNNLSRFGKLHIEVDTSTASAAPLFSTNPPLSSLSARAAKAALLLVGGGKDSNVSAQLLHQANIDFTPFAVNPKGPIFTSIETMEKRPLFVERQLDPAMLALSRQPGFFNGHVPSTAINAMIASLIATLFDFDTIILSNERSASEPNMAFDGRPVNHQHSKSLVFEKLLGRTLSQTSHNHLKCFSLLRPLSELKIAQLFSQTRIFDAKFSSCNSNFKQDKNDTTNKTIRWCNTCPKCHFVYLMLAPFMIPDRLLNIFGDTPLSRPENMKSFSALAGLSDQKPWECVGETMEAAATIHKLSTMPPFQSTPLIEELATKLVGKHGEKKLIAVWNDLFIDSKDHCVPERFNACLPNG